MWKLKYISCSDFISFKKAELEIPQNVCSLIYGQNNDNIQQRNNGTGKSSIIEAIAFALTGEPLRAVSKAEEIINDHSETANVYVELVNDFDNTLFTINRTLSRKCAQSIVCHKYKCDGDNTEEIEKDKTSQPTVLDYNKYILEEVGLTKEDIYSNFILSNNKYKSFFDANDKTKKAMINRFSGADAVDDAIDKLRSDMCPAIEALEKARNEKIAMDAKLDVVCNQLISIQNKRAEWLEAKQNRINAIYNQIAEKREELRGNTEQIRKANSRLDSIDEAGAYIEDMQNVDTDLPKAYQYIIDVFGKYNLTPIKNYVELSNSISNKIASIKTKQDELKDEYIKLKNICLSSKTHFEDVNAKYNELKTQTEKFNEEDKLEVTRIEQEIDNTQRKVINGVTELNKLQDKADSFERSIRQLNNQLHGAITCPNCQHEFFLDKSVSVSDVKKQISTDKKAFESVSEQIQTLDCELSKCKEERNSFEKQKAGVEKEIDIRNHKLSDLTREFCEASISVDNAFNKVCDTENKIGRLQEDIFVEQGRINGLMKQMFSEALDIIDNAITKGERYVKTLEENNIAVNASIESFEKAIEDAKNSSQDDLVASLSNSKTEYEKRCQEANNTLEMAQNEYNKYVIQENHFIDFRSYLANKKVEAIAGITNHFLELIGSDLRVEMLGYKKLKSGKVRDKITVNLLRNGVDCGSYAKFSGGERARVNLASILGLQKLTNNSAPKGKGLDLLILDEILEASDTTGIESSCRALNKLKATSLLVTQNPISDNDGNAIVVVKENGYSTIKE